MELPADNWIFVDDGPAINLEPPVHYFLDCCNDDMLRVGFPRNYKLIIRPPPAFEPEMYFIRGGGLYALKCVYCQCLNLGLALDDRNVFDVPREFEEAGAEFDEYEIMGLWE
jgi:hypothetical protein